MKRSARDLELQVVAHDMVETARGVEASPVLVVLTYAIDPLLEVLRSRPILLINLMRSSRALYDAWSAIPNLWIMLLEQVMQAVRPERFRFYPFYAMQLERTWYQLHAVEKAVDWDALPNGTAALRGIEHTYDMITSRIGWSDHNGYIALDFVVNDDVVVPAYLALMRHLFYIGVALATDLWLRTPTIARDFYKNTDESIVLNVRRHKYEPFGDFLQATTWSGGWGSSSEPRQHPPELVTIMREQVQAIADELNAFGHGPLLGSEVEITRVAGESRTSTWHHPEVARALDVLVRLADRALFALNRLFAAAEEEGPEPDAYLPRARGCATRRGAAAAGSEGARHEAVSRRALALLRHARATARDALP